MNLLLCIILLVLFYCYRCIDVLTRLTHFQKGSSVHQSLPVHFSRCIEWKHHIFDMRLIELYCILNCFRNEIENKKTVERLIGGSTFKPKLSLTVPSYICLSGCIPRNEAKFYFWVNFVLWFSAHIKRDWVTGILSKDGDVNSCFWSWVVLYILDKMGRVGVSMEQSTGWRGRSTQY